MKSTKQVEVQKRLKDVSTCCWLICGPISTWT
jgi:hypothetical protein